jgi:four helix bundle protein
MEGAMSLKTYRDLVVWQKAMDLVEAVYLLVADFPSTEKFGLVCQIQRAAVSVPANIAEGYGRTHRGDYLHHLSIAKGSFFELETHLLLAVRLKLVSRDALIPIWRLSQEVGKMLTKLIRSLKKKRDTNPIPSPQPPPYTLNPKP